MAGEIESHEGNGTFVKATESALIVTEEGQLRMVMADFEGQIGVPQAVMLLASVFVKSNDDAWVGELVSELIDKFGDDEGGNGSSMLQ